MGASCHNMECRPSYVALPAPEFRHVFGDLGVGKNSKGHHAHMKVQSGKEGQKKGLDGSPILHVLDNTKRKK